MRHTVALQAGADALRQGDLPRAAKLLGSILQQDERHVDALQLLGLVAHRMGHSADALDLLDRALAEHPRHAPALANRGLVLMALGRAAEAAEALDKCLSVRPDFPAASLRLARVRLHLGHVEAAERAILGIRADSRSTEAWVLLAEVRRRGGDLEGTVEALGRALVLDSRDPRIHAALGDAHRQLSNLGPAQRHLDIATRLAPADLDAWLALGRCLRDAGSPAGALEAYARARQHHPDSAPLHNDVGSAHRRAGDVDAAIASWERALELDDQLAEAAHNLGTALREVGSVAEALDLHTHAVRLEPGVRTFWIGWADALSVMAAPPADLVVELEQCLDTDGVDHQLLDRAVRATLESEGWQPAIATLRADPTAAFDPAGVPALLGRPVVQKWLRRAIVQDNGWEEVLRRHRAALLAHAAEGGSIDPDVAASLAIQAYNTEYAWWVEPHEQQLLAALGTHHPVVQAMYATPPVHLPPGGPALAELQALLVEHPRREAQLGGAIPTLGIIDDPVSIAVRDQYEASPYPRLVSQHRKPPAPLHALVHQLFPHVEGLIALDRPRVLIAGCGTGQQVLAAANRYANAQITAVDLSRASLGAAARRAEQAGHAVAFLHGDILALGQLSERFHLVEAGGVLHHMADPVAGWRVLVDITAPGGLLKVGLYSELARDSVSAARDLARAEGWQPTPVGIRRARRALAALPAGHPARANLRSIDFYSISGCRDLFLHVWERRFTLHGLAAAIAELGLEFLGFQHSNPEVSRLYAARNPGDATQTDLDGWGRFEEEVPQAFSGMYQFWCRRPA